MQMVTEPVCPSCFPHPLHGGLGGEGAGGRGGDVGRGGGRPPAGGAPLGGGLAAALAEGLQAPTGAAGRGRGRAADGAGRAGGSPPADGKDGKGQLDDVRVWGFLNYTAELLHFHNNCRKNMSRHRTSKRFWILERSLANIQLLFFEISGRPVLGGLLSCWNRPAGM